MGKEFVMMPPFESKLDKDLARLTARLNVFQAVLQATDLQPSLKYYLEKADAIVPHSFDLWIKRTSVENLDYQKAKKEEANRIFAKDLQTAQRFQKGVTIKGEHINELWRTIIVGPGEERNVSLEELIFEEEFRIAEIMSRLLK